VRYPIDLPHFRGLVLYSADQRSASAEKRRATSP
jgi:hypothetical protein